MNLKYKLCRAGAFHPERQFDRRCGVVFKIPKHTWEHETCQVGPGMRVVIETGIKMQLPEGKGLLITSIPELTAKFGLQTENTMIHQNHTNEVIITLHSINVDHDVFLSEGDEIAIGYIVPIEDFSLVEDEGE